MGRKGPKPKTYSHFQVTLDKFLGSKNLCRKAIAKDGSCLFRAVAEQVLLSQSYHHHVRLQCADYISRHRDDFKEFLTVKLDEYLRRLRIGQLWGGEVELVVFSKMYRRSIVVYNQQVNQVQEQIFLTPEDEAAGRRTEELIDPIYLAYTDGNHYDSVYLRKSKGNLAFCQSVVYSLLYEKVFEETLSQATKQRLRNITDADVQKLAMEGDKGDKHLTFLSKTYPLGVLEGMAPNCFSNTSLHVYQRERDCIERQDRDVAAAIQFQIGDKCLVPVPGDSQLYNGEITSSITPNGCHLVYIFEAGEQWEIPCKDITVPSNSLSSAASTGRRSGGPPHAWSKVHQRIQPGFPRGGRGTSDETPPTSSLLPLPPNLLPIATTAAHIPSPSTPPPGTTEQNHSVQKAYQSIPKSTNGTKTLSGKPLNKPLTASSGSTPASQVPVTGKGEVGVASQQGVWRSGEVVDMETQGRRRSGGGAGIQGGTPPGFSVGREHEPVPKPPKVSEADKPANLPGRPAAVDVRNPGDRKFPPSPPATSAPPQLPGGYSNEGRVVVHSASFPPANPTGPRASPDDSAATTKIISEECVNGATQTANPKPPPVPYFLPHPMGRYVYLPEGQAPIPNQLGPVPIPSQSGSVPVPNQPGLVQIPNQPNSVQIPNQQTGPQTVGGVVSEPVMHAPVPHPHLTAQQMGRRGGEEGRESPYFDSQINHLRSSQPEEAWPMVGEEEPHPNPHPLPPQQSSPPPGHMPPRYMFPFGIPTPSDQGIVMRPPHFPGIPPPGGPAPPGGPVSIQHMFPFFLAPPHQPFPAHQPHPLEVETESKEVQTSPYPSPVLKKDKEVDVRPATVSVGLQCTGVARRESSTNTDPQGTNQPLFLADDIKPPAVSAQAYLLSGDVQGQIRVLTEYAEQCLRLYERAEPDLASPALDLAKGLGERVQRMVEERERKTREVVRSEMREEVKEEVRQEIWDQVREEVRAELMEDMQHKPLNVDEQNFLQLFTNSQPDRPPHLPPHHLAEHGRYPAYFPHFTPSPVPPNKMAAVPRGRSAELGEDEDADSLGGDGEANEEDTEVLPHQEASVPPYPQMAPGPMMVPPGARPVVFPPMPGMPWYPHYMPFPFLVPPHHQMLPHVVPPVGLDERSSSSDDHQLSQNDPQLVETPEVQEEYQVSTGGQTVDTTSTDSGVVGDGTTTGKEIPQVTAAKPPFTFPSADIQTEIDIDEIEGPEIASHFTESLSLSTSAGEMNLLVNQSPSRNRSPSPSNTQLPAGGTEPTGELKEGGLRPGLPCRRKGVAEVTSLPQETGEEQSKEEKAESVTVTPPTNQRQYSGKGKGGRQGSGHHRGRNRDGVGGRGYKSSHHDRRHGSSSSEQAATPPQTSVASHTHSWPADTPTTSSVQSKTPPNNLSVATPTSQSQVQTTQSRVQTTQSRVQTDQSRVQTTQSRVQSDQSRVQTTQSRVQTDQSRVQDSSTVRSQSHTALSGTEKESGGRKTSDEAVKKSAKSGDEGVKVAGSKGSLSGGNKASGGGGKGGRGGRPNRGRGGKEVPAVSKTTAETSEREGKEVGATSAPVVKSEESESATSEMAPKNTRQNLNKGGSNQKYYRGKRAGGGGSNSSRTYQTSQPNHSQASSSSNHDDAHQSRYQTSRGGGGGGGGGGGKSGRGESRAKAKRVNSVPDSGERQSQEPTRSSCDDTPRKPSPDRIVEQLPSFKNLYSSTPEREETAEYLTQGKESWPSMTQIDQDHPTPTFLPPHYSLSPDSPLLPHFPPLNQFFPCQDSMDSPMDSPSHLLTIFPALLSRQGLVDAESAPTS